MFIGDLALPVAAIFTGAAFYIGFAEQPARLNLDDRALLIEWKPAYKRGFAMQAPLAVVGFILGVIAWWLSGRMAFLAGAVLLVANWPWTMLAIAPVNGVLMTMALDTAGRESRLLILKWNRLHAIRTMLGFGAMVCFLIALRSN
ncbi:MAG: DUF1772 domain-containing protein [Deltaproteobacteria bacterium]|nr:DUF1772 domain-containing protein [Deltaproteobacteria bacterium]